MAQSLREFTKDAVIIDDGYAPANLNKIEADHWAQLRHANDEGGWAQIKEKFAAFVDVGRPNDLRRNDEALNLAWSLYEANPENHSVFDPIFSHVYGSRIIDIRPLIPLTDYLRSERIEIRQHYNLANAIEDIKRSKLIFLDFYLFQSSPDKIIKAIAKYREIFSSEVIENNESGHGRLVFLISTDLPSSDDLERFRKATGVKAAFFKPVGKKQLSAGWLSRELSDRLHRYPDMQRLTNFLEMFSKQILHASDTLRAEIDSLELHDLSILHSMRLDVEQESMGQYLSWIFSEALAAKIRNSTPLAHAADELGQIRSVPFSGHLTPKSVLFDFYSEIAFSKEDSLRQRQKSQFGDVYSPIWEHRVDYRARMGVTQSNILDLGLINFSWVPKYKNPALLKSSELKSMTFRINSNCQKVLRQADRGETELLLVISPACDLLRCPIDYEVACVKGIIVKRAPTLADLFGHSAYSMTENVFRHLMKHESRTGISYLLIEWNPKQMTMVRESNLVNNAKYVRRARLNEVFCHGVKEDALRKMGRVGVPVDPSFMVPLDAIVRIKTAKKTSTDFESENEEFVSGMFVAGNGNNPAKLILSEEFIAWLEILIEKMKGSEFEITGNIQNSFSTIMALAGEGITVNEKGEKDFSGGLKFKYVTEHIRGKFEPSYGIILYPRGRLADPIPSE